MKRILLIGYLEANGCMAFAQQGCSKTLPLFRFENLGTPKAIYKLGAAPQFTFLQHQATPATFLASIMKHENEAKYKNGMNELNSLLVEIGFNNGIKDLTQSAITEAYIPVGEVGKMGDWNYNYSYMKFAGTKPFKAWKITSDKGYYMYIMVACGNAFYPESAAKELQPVAMLDTREFQGNVVSEPELTVKEMPKTEEDTDEPEDCYCKFRRMYKGYYPHHSARENRYRRVYGPGDYPKYCSTGKCSTSCGK